MERLSQLWKKWKFNKLGKPKWAERKNKEEIKNVLKRRLKRYFLSIDFIHYFATRKRNLKEYKHIQTKNAAIAADNLVKGLGGDKNLVKVKNTVYSIQIIFKSDYLLEKEILSRSGGLEMRIVDRSLFSIFDKRETKLISRRIRQIIKDAKRKYKPIEID